MSAVPGGSRDAVALLERAIGYTRAALGHVRAELLGAETPCEEWNLRALLEHLDDALAAFTDAGDSGAVGLAPLRWQPDDDHLVQSLRLRACDVLGSWVQRTEEAPVRVGGACLDAGTLATAGALEIAVHGWDVARACGADLPIPGGLAQRLLPVAAELVRPTDRPWRFGPAREGGTDDPAVRLLAFLGR